MVRFSLNILHQEKSKSTPCGLGQTFSLWVGRTRRGSGVERTSGGRPRPRKTGCDICEANSSEMPRISCVDSRETESLKVHQKNNGFFGSRYFLFKTEGLGMASIRIANCMELPVGRMASRLAVYLLFLSVLIPHPPLSAAKPCRMVQDRHSNNRWSFAFS